MAESTLFLSFIFVASTQLNDPLSEALIHNAQLYLPVWGCS